jgi:hypothetical protein
VVKLPALLQPGPHGTAKRLRKSTESVPNENVVVMTTVVCYQCGEKFSITHRSSCSDQALAARQAVWLEDKFVWDHIQENDHPGSIQLPGSGEMKLSGPRGV